MATETVVISARRSISGPGGTLNIDCSIEEQGVDTLTITEHPVEIGATISDHAYINPARLTLRAGWSNSSSLAGGDENYVVDVYNFLLQMQASRDLLSVVTGKRSYSNMLIESLSQTTDEETETTLMVTITLREVIIVSTQTTVLPPTANQSMPGATADASPQGTVQPIPSGVTPVASNPATQEVTV
jgi:hypothetical protein